MLRCQDHPYLRAGEVDVRATRSVDGRLEALVADSVFYPEGGGQPSDHGTLAPEGATAVRVTEARRAPEGVWLEVDGPVPVGPALATVDWTRRYDHMQQHTTQHLLTALALARFGWATTTFHLAQSTPGAPPPCSIELDRPDLPEAERLDLEDEANALVREARPVRVRSLPRDALAAHGVRSRLLPADLDGPVRLIEIDGVDLNTCGGTHVASTAELHGIVLGPTERARGRTRLYWMSGQRLLGSARAAGQRERALSSRLTCGADHHLAAVERLQEAARGAEREIAAARAAGHDAIGRAIRAGAVPGLRVGPGDATALRDIARSAVDGTERGVVLVSDEGLFLVAGPAAWVSAVGPRVAAALGGRGGGRGERYQGSGGDPGRLDAAVAVSLNLGV